MMKDLNHSAASNKLSEDKKPEPAKSGLAARALSLSQKPNASQNADLSNYINALNPEQREAVITTEGPLLVLAGAGTGKTRVLTTRIAHILSLGLAYPNQILSVTFTNKAAREMKQRIGQLVGGAIEGMPWLGTFHSIGVKILRRHCELVGLSSNFTILDSDDIIRLIKQLISAEGLDEKRWPARNFAQLIDNWKNAGWHPEQVPEAEIHAFANGRGRKLYRAYQERLKTLNACDFGDLLLLPIYIFQHHADVLAQYHRQFRYILVDEYQDTNTAQYLWLRLLAKGNKDGDVNLCCVGDDDQSIYGWRGAKVENILRFEKDFPCARTIRLERNYRSTAHILGAAGHLIEHNDGRLGKTLFADQEDLSDSKVQIHAGWDSQEEARAIGDEIENLHRQGHSLNEIAILVRASFQMREFEDRFVTLGLNYRVIGGPRFYERREIRDAMAYFRLTVQPADDLAFERIINVPKRGIGEATLRQLHDYARKSQQSLLHVSSAIVHTDELKPKVRHALNEIVTNFQRWQNMLTNTPHVELAETILEESNYTAMWQNDRSADAPGRLENLKELLRSMEEFESLAGFLEHISLVMDSEKNDNLDAVNIMTLHSAKGLEFNTVILPGWEEGLFPHQRALDDGGREGLEEERRLAYVGLTRAKKNLHIWFVANRRVHGSWQSTLPSRFIDELPEAHVEVSGADSSYGGYNNHSQDPFENSYTTPGWQRAQRHKTQATTNNWGTRSGANVDKMNYRQAESGFGHTNTIEGEVVAKFTNTTQSPFKIGDRVFHQKFGNGNITLIDANKLTIAFDKAGEKRVLQDFVELVS